MKCPKCGYIRFKYIAPRETLASRPTKFIPRSDWKRKCARCGYQE